MKQITKIVQQIGNGGHIYVPKELIGQKVVISVMQKTLQEIEKEIFEVLQPYLKHILGIYLYGSYARNEQTPESDIDVFVVTDGKVKIEHKIQDYDIISASEKEIKKTIDHNAVLILPILNEAKPIVNEELIEKYKDEKLTRKNSQWYIETTESALKLAKEWIEDEDQKAIQYIVYPLIMRLRGLLLIDSLFSNNPYSNKKLIYYMIKNNIEKTKFEQLYNIYREHRDNKSISKNSITYEDIKRLYEIINNYFNYIKRKWEKLR